MVMGYMVHGSIFSMFTNFRFLLFVITRRSEETISVSCVNKATRHALPTADMLYFIVLKLLNESGQGTVYAYKATRHALPTAYFSVEFSGIPLNSTETNCSVESGNF